jgi:uncharacterized protein (TIGR03435 family)
VRFGAQVSRFWFLAAAAASVAGCQELVFEVVSVKPVGRTVGPDYNNQFLFSGSGLSAKHATVRRLVAEAFRVQMNQVLGPQWMDELEFKLEARTSSPVTRQQMAPMLRAMLEERFGLKQHTEMREMRAFELVVDPKGLKINGDELGGNFRGEMRALADLIAVQVTILSQTEASKPGLATGPPAPVLDRTGLEGIYSLDINLQPEAGLDVLTLWQRLLPKFGLKLNSRKAPVTVVVIDSALRVPIQN